MRYTVNIKNFQDSFPVPLLIADRYIKLAGAAQLKVLLYLSRRCGEALSDRQIAEAVGLAPEDVRDAAVFWVEHGVLQAGETAPPTSGDGPAMPTERPTQVSQPSPTVLPAAPSAEPVFVAEPETPADSATEREGPSPAARERDGVRVLSTEIPRLRSAEIQARQKNNQEIRFLLEEAEPRLKRPLTTTDLSTIIALHEWIGLSCDVILMVLEYCTSIGKNNARSLERTAIEFFERGCTTHEAAEAYIREREQEHERHSLVRRLFGIGDRKLIISERQHIDRWMDEWKFGSEMIGLAYEKCVEQTGKLSFPYINKILKAWSEGGIATPKDAENERARYQQAKEKQGETPQPSYDLELFETNSLYHMPEIKKRK